MSAHVMTALGPVSVTELGITSMHEHLVLGMPGWEFNRSYTYDEKETLRVCVENVNAAKAYGLRTIVDATPADLARNPGIYKAVQEETGVNIICSTGLYTEDSGNSAYWRLLVGAKGYGEALKLLTESYIHDITVGIDGTGVKSSLIKVSVGATGISKLEELSVHAGVLAHKETGAPIISHTGSPSMGPHLAAMLKEYGADMKHVMIGHMCDTDDVDLLVRTLEYGGWLGLDRFGLNSVLEDKKKCQTLCKLVKLGYIDKLLVGHDSTIFNHCGCLMPDGVLATLTDWNLCGLFKTFFPEMKKLGLSDENITTLMVENPKCFFDKN